MFKLAVVIFCAMTFGYAFGRIQQFNIDDLIPVLFIVEKYDEQEKGHITTKYIRIINGDWIKNKNLEEIFSKGGKGLLIPSDKNFSMFFPIEIDELEDKLVFVNSAKKSKLRNHDYIKCRFSNAKLVKKTD